MPTSTPSPFPFQAITAWLALVSLCGAQTTERFSVDPGGIGGDADSTSPEISTDGKFIVFESQATNLVPGDTNFQYDIFVYERATGALERVSVSSTGVEGNLGSFTGAISADGQIVSFVSSSDTLVPGGNFNSDVFVRDRLTSTTTQVSVDSFGTPANGTCGGAAISADGNLVAFTSFADNLVAGDTNGRADAFVHNRTTGVTQRVSVDFLGNQADSGTSGVAFSGDGNIVAFYSGASNLVAGDTNGYADIFTHDLTTGITERVSVSSTGVEGDKWSLLPTLSYDGRYVAFESHSTNLVAGDTNGDGDIFVHDRVTGTTKRVSVDANGVQADGKSTGPEIADDGRHIVFMTLAKNLIPGDTNSYFDICLYDRVSGAVEKISNSSDGVYGNGHSWWPSVSETGETVVFASDAENLVSGDTNSRKDTFVRERLDGLGTNFIVLEGPTVGTVGNSIDLTWYSARPNSSFWLYYSLNVNGFTYLGHSFDLGTPQTLLDNGTNLSNGNGSYTSPPLPPGAAGLTIYCEVAALDGGVLYDSNALGISVF